MSVSPQSRDARGEDREVAGVQARLNLAGLPVIERASMMRELTYLIRIAIKDKTYQASPLGQEVARYLRALRWEGKSPNTLLAYEPVLAMLALRFADFASLEQFASHVGTDYLREFLDDEWGATSDGTRAHRLAILRSFFNWAVIERKISYDPTRPIRAPRGRGKIRQAYPRSVIRQLVDNQESLRDEVALLLLFKLALRKNDLRMLQIQDIDLIRNVIACRHAKGGEEHLVPFESEHLHQLLYLHIQGEQREPAEYLLYPRQDRQRPMDLSSVHRWFKNCLEQAGLPRSVLMHELRHSSADELWRETGNLVLVQQHLRHRSAETTRQYLHPSEEDHRAGLRIVENSWSSNPSDPE